jgi:glycerophosphoryl diester phosphodiesterase
VAGDVSNPTSRTWLLGHRGLRIRGLRRLTSSAPAENSMAAFEYALSQRCDGFEFDVRHTRDGRNVLWHDAEFAGREIAATDFADLVARDGTRLAYLEEVLQQFGHRAYLDIEIKVSGHEGEVAAALKQNPPRRGYMLSSFLPQVLLRLNEIDGQIPLGYICERVPLISLWQRLPIKIFLPRHDLLQPQLVEEVHRYGKEIVTWTVNSAMRMQELTEWGVDGLISDDPGLLFRTLGGGRAGE